MSTDIWVASRRIVLLAAFVAMGSVSSALKAQVDSSLTQGPKAVATGQEVMVSTQLPAVTEGALQVLRNGGNAADAMITAVFLQHVNDYHQVSHFGSMSAIYYEAETGEYYSLNAVSDRPLADRCEGKGDPNSVAIGGVVRGLAALQERFGTMTWEEYLAPAIRDAREGVPVTSFMYTRNYDKLRGEDGLIENRAAQRFYLPDGFLVPVGQRWKMPEFADHLERLAAEGSDYMYTGEWGEKFVASAQERGYCVTMEDMADYTVRWQEPLHFTYREHELVGSPPPDEGGAIVGYNLQILENFDLAEMGHYSESAETLEVMARTFGRVSNETSRSIQDPLSFRNPTEIWLSDEYGRIGAEFVEQTRSRGGADLSAQSARASKPDTEVAYADQNLGSNHNVIVDSEGNWISLLHTGHGGAPGIFIDGAKATGSSGFGMVQGEGRRLVLPITAIMIKGADGAPRLAMGTPGYPPQPVTEVLVNILDFGMSPKEAAEAPRFWAFRTGASSSFADYELPVIEIESRISDATHRGVEEAGLRIVELGPFFWSTGSMQIVWRDGETGRLYGATDPRRLGKAGGY